MHIYSYKTISNWPKCFIYTAPLVVISRQVTGWQGQGQGQGGSPQGGGQGYNGQQQQGPGGRLKIVLRKTENKYK